VHVSIGGASRDTARTTFHLGVHFVAGTIKVTTSPRDARSQRRPDGYTVFAESGCDYYSCVYNRRSLWS